MAKTQKKKEILFYQKVKNNRKWYFENFLKIRDKRSKLVPFKVNEGQQLVLDLIEDCEKNGKLKRFIVLKARQLGISTLTEGLIFHDTVTNSYRNSMIIAHEDKATSNLFNMSKLYLEELPEVLRPMVRHSNEKALTFENPSNDSNEKRMNPGLRSKYTVATAGTAEAGRSATIHNLHASEVAFFPDARKTMLGLLQSVPDELNTLVVLESTANGVGDYFHELWKQAERGENDFIPVFLPWFQDISYSKPFDSDEEKEEFQAVVEQVTTDMQGNRRNSYAYNLMVKHGLTLEQLHWRQWAIRNKCAGDEVLFMQEYPATPEEAFIASGRPKFPSNVLQKYQTITRDPQRGNLHADDVGQVEFVEDPNGFLSVWKHPENDMFYCIGSDVAEGLAKGDYSCGIVGDGDFDVAAMWHGHIDPDLFGIELVKLAKYYNDAYLGVENNNHGNTTLNTIKREEYWNLYFSKSYDRINDEITTKLGWTTSLRTKPLMIDKLAEFIREMHLGIFSDLIISEMYSYVIEDNGKTNAQKGCYDDAVMALAIALQLMLEGRGDNYTPEIPIDERRRRPKEIIDELFELEKTLEISV